MHTHRHVIIWRFVLFCFTVAVVAGVAFRVSFIWPTPLNLVHVRHAHSHLMAFGWIMPAFMLLIPRFLPSDKGFAFWTLATILTGLLSFFLFWRWGYGVATFGSIVLPPAVIACTLQILAWFGYLTNYLIISYRRPRTAPLLFFDLAFCFLFGAGLGALAISFVHRFPALHISPKLLSVWFLYMFKLGWCVTALLGLLLGELGVTRLRSVLLGLISLAIGTPLSFLINVPGRHAWGRFGGILLSMGLLTLLLVAARQPNVRKRVWVPTLTYFACLALILLVVCFTGWTHWVQDHQKRLIFIHLLMLGSVSSGLLTHAASQGYVQEKDLRYWHGSVFLLLAGLSLLLAPSTILPPSLLNGILALTACGPGLCILYLLRPGSRQLNST